MKKIVLSGHSDIIRDLIYSSKGNMLISGGLDNLIKLWSLDALTNVATLLGHTNFVRSLMLVGFETLISSSRDGTIKFWNLNSAQCVKNLTGHGENGSHGVGKMGIMIDGVLVTCGDDLCVRFWSLSN